MLISHLEKESGPLNVVPADSFRYTLSLSVLQGCRLCISFDLEEHFFSHTLFDFHVCFGSLFLLHHQASLKLEVMNILMQV